jgi:uncharacterized protein (DUF58 family)
MNSQGGATLRNLHFFAAAATGLAVLLFADRVNAQQPFTLSISVPQTVVRAGSEVRIQVTLKNVSEHEIGILRSTPDYDYTVDVRDAHDKSAMPTEFARKLRAPDSVRVAPSNVLYPLKPHETLVDKLIVSKLFEMGLGKYTIRVAREIPQELGGGSVRSNLITVIVTK